MAPLEGQLIAMAIPLGRPQQQSGAPPPPAYHPSPLPPGPAMTSTPLTGTMVDHKVALVNIHDEEIAGRAEKEVRFEVTAAKKPTLTTQVETAVLFINTSQTRNLIVLLIH